MDQQQYYSSISKQYISKWKVFGLDFAIATLVTHCINFAFSRPYQSFRMHLKLNPKTKHKTLIQYIGTIDIKALTAQLHLKPRLGVYYAVKELLRVTQGLELNNNPYFKWAMSNFLIGGTSGFITNFLFYTESSKYKIIIKRWISQRMKQFQPRVVHGYMAETKLFIETFCKMYRGFLVSSIASFGYRGFYYGIFDTLKISLPNNFLIHTILGTISSLVGSVFMTPIVVVVKQSLINKTLYKNKFDCFQKVLKQQGASMFINRVKNNKLTVLFSGLSLSSIECLQFMVYSQNQLV